MKKFAHIKKDIAVKSFLWSVSKNYMGLADRLKDANKSHHADLVKFWGAFGSFQDLANAVNKGSKKGATFSGVNYRSDRSNLNSSYMGEEGGSGDQAKQYEEGAKASVGIIKQILDFFAKRKKDKQARIPFAEIRYLPEKYSGPAATNIYGDKVAIILWSKENPLAIVIKNKEIAESYKKFFELMWRISKK